MDPAIVHGDFRLGNLLAHGTEIKAIIDWEIWTVGDPRVDVGWFLINADPDTYARPTPYVGLMPPVDELAARYADGPRPLGPRPRSLPSAGVLQVSRHVVAHRQAQPSARRA